MPLLFALGQHPALVAVQRSLKGDERLLAFLDDIHIIISPARVGVVVFARGKTQVWNGAGIRPPACEALEWIARAVDPRAVVWKGPELPVEDQGIKVLGTPLGHPEFITAHLERITAEHRVLLD